MKSLTRQILEYAYQEAGGVSSRQWSVMACCSTTREPFNELMTRCATIEELANASRDRSI